MTSLSETLRVQAAAGRGESLETARRANDFQARTRAVTRRMMATISELSMCQVRKLPQCLRMRTLHADWYCSSSRKQT